MRIAGQSSALRLTETIAAMLAPLPVGSQQSDDYSVYPKGLEGPRAGQILRFDITSGSWLYRSEFASKRAFSRDYPGEQQ